MIPFGRAALPEEIAEMVAFLASTGPGTSPGRPTT
jgi:NAD(P)-dependent dehydrogenase (short-subunit alcohol dehydrogenase family)